jgi:predicted molibdopterin-dependent oxidoreductase YjgC
VDNPDAQKKFEEAWGVKLDNSVGLTHTIIFDEAYNGNIKGIYVVGENPILSEANAHHAREAIKKMDFMVVQDIFLTETAQLADVVLPGAAFAEKDGTVTNTERRVQRMYKAIDPPGEAKQDWWITSEIAKRVGGKGFDFEDPQEIFEEIRSLTPSYAGITYERITDQGLQWPCPTEDHPGTPILHTEKFPRGLGNFVPLEYRESAEVPDREYPFILTTDRSLFHFHTSTMTRQVKGLEDMESEELLKINPEDAKNLGVSDEEIVKISSRRGKLDVKVKTTDICPPGVVSMTFHFHEIPTNDITNPALDPVAKIPETKVAAVRIDKL